MLTAIVSGSCRAAAVCVSCDAIASLLVVKLPKSLPWCLARLGTRQSGLASVQAQDGHAAAAAEHVVIGRGQAGRRLSC